MSCGSALMTSCEVAVLIESSCSVSSVLCMHGRTTEPSRHWFKNPISACTSEAEGGRFMPTFFTLWERKCILAVLHKSLNVSDAPNEVQTCPHLHMNSRHESPANILGRRSRLQQRVNPGQSLLILGFNLCVIWTCCVFMRFFFFKKQGFLDAVTEQGRQLIWVQFCPRTNMQGYRGSKRCSGSVITGDTRT